MDDALLFPIPDKKSREQLLVQVGCETMDQQIKSGRLLHATTLYTSAVRTLKFYDAKLRRFGYIFNVQDSGHSTCCNIVEKHTAV